MSLGASPRTEQQQPADEHRRTPEEEGEVPGPPGVLGRGLVDVVKLEQLVVEDLLKEHDQFAAL